MNKDVRASPRLRRFPWWTRPLGWSDPRTGPSKRAPGVIVGRRQGAEGLAWQGYVQQMGATGADAQPLTQGEGKFLTLLKRALEHRGVVERTQFQPHLTSSPQAQLGDARGGRTHRSRSAGDIGFCLAGYRLKQRRRRPLPAPSSQIDQKGQREGAGSSGQSKLPGFQVHQSPLSASSQCR